jgi:hypothetical protein
MAGIGDDDSHIIAGRDAPFGLAVHRADRYIHAFDTQLATSGHSVMRVYHKVEDGGLELNRIDLGRP